jgi:hypothetical protein
MAVSDNATGLSTWSAGAVSMMSSKASADDAGAPTTTRCRPVTSAQACSATSLIAPAWTSSTAPESSKAKAISGAASRVFSGTKIAPNAVTAKNVSRNDGSFSPR